jgi:hypothetical protein
MYIPRRPEGIISNFGSEVKLEDSSSWRLDFVGNIRMKELGSGKSIGIRSSKSVGVDHYLSAPFQRCRRKLTDNIIKIPSSRNCVRGMFMEWSKVSTKRSMSLDIKSVLFSENCNQCPV